MSLPEETLKYRVFAPNEIDGGLIAFAVAGSVYSEKSVSGSSSRLKILLTDVTAT
jgi:hypothetical protein